MRKLIYMLFLCVCATINYGQQEALLTQFVYNKLALNPAYSTMLQDPTLNFSIRSQWIGLPGAPQTQILSFGLPISTYNTGIGVKLQNQSLGITQRTSLSAMYAYQLMSSDSGQLSLGLNATGKRYSLDFTDPKLVAADVINIDPSIPRENFARMFMSVGFGVYYNTPSYYVGLSTTSLTQKHIKFAESDLKTPNARHVYFMGGYSFPLEYNLLFQPQILVRYADDTPLGWDINAGIVYDEKYAASITYRAENDGYKGESLDVVFGIQLTEAVLFSLSYDYILSKLAKTQHGSLEFSVQYAVQRPQKRQMINPRHF